MSDSSSISVKDDFCSPDKSSVDNSLRYLQQVRMNQDVIID